MYIQTQASVLANVVNDNAIAGNQFEFAPVTSAADSGTISAHAGMEVDILIGARSVVTRMLPLVKATAPIYPDDFTVKGGAQAGERVIIRLRNTTGAPINSFIPVKYNPV